MMNHIKLRSGAPKNGSVLIFAVVVLAILAMLSTAFLVVARHAIQSARAGVTSTQPELSSYAAEKRLQGSLSAYAKGLYTATPDGVVGIDSSGNLILVSASEVDNKGPGSTSTSKMFDHDITFDNSNSILTPTFAVLSSAYPHVNGAGTAISTPYYTTAPLRISSLVPSTGALVSNADRASAYFIRTGLTDFYNGVTTAVRKQLPGTGTVRGRHFIWVRDLDANFYANPSMWGMDMANIPNYSPGYTVSNSNVAGNILSYLRTTPASFMTSTVSQGDLDHIASLQPTEAYDNIGAFALKFPNYNNYIADPAHFPLWRSDLETYWSTCIDAARNPDGSFKTNAQGAYISQCKTAPAAININTAPEEVVQAMLSQIPYSDTLTFATYFPAGAGTPCYAELIAKRILAKRPFLCRMDFEDFIASLLPGDPADGTTLSPVFSVKYALAKRIDREISLAKFMEIPSLPEGDYTDTNGAFVDTNPYKDSNTRQRMMNRFQFFLDDSGSPVTRVQCVLTVKAFNNFLNSVSTSPGPSVNVYNYTQLIAPGATGAPNAPEIQGVIAGVSFSGIHLGGDDAYIYDASNKIIGINTGPNGIAETQITGFSYYSHDYGGRVPNEYRPARLLTDPAFLTLDPSSQKDCGKFVYGVADPDPLKNYMPLTAQTTPPGYKNYGLADLQKWSCIGDGTLSGYYDMFFNAYDSMKFEFAQKTDAMPPSPADVHIESSKAGEPLHTGLKSDDMQQVDFGDPVFDPATDFIVIGPGPNLKIETEPNKNNSVLAPVPGQAAPAGDDVVVQAIRLSTFDPFDAVPVGTDVFSTAPGDDTYYYIVPKLGTTQLLTSPRPVNPDNPDPTDVDVLVQVIVDGGNGISDTQIENDDVLDPVLNVITVGPNLHAETTVWGPIRATQRSQDQQLASNFSQIPTANLFSGSALNGDVAWSPQICFRSRFFGTYVLAQGLTTQAKNVVKITSVAPVGTNVLTIDPADLGGDSTALVPGALIAVTSKLAGYATLQLHVYTIESFSGSSTITLTSPLIAQVNISDSTDANDRSAIYSTKISGERRVESIYDAYNDEVLWSRSPLTDKRGLGDPK